MTVDDVRSAPARTAAAGALRVEFVVEHRWPRGLRASGEPPPRSGLRGRAAGLAARAFGAGVRAGLSRLPTTMTAEGILDLAGARYMVDFGSYATLGSGGRRWSGRSGRRVDTLDAQPERFDQPLWLFDALRGCTGVEERDGGTRAICDLLVARDELGRDVPVADASTLDAQRTVGLEVAIAGDGLIRSVRYAASMSDLTVTVLATGVRVPEDWTRLPTFRTPA